MACKFAAVVLSLTGDDCIKGADTEAVAKGEVTCVIVVLREVLVLAGEDVVRVGVLVTVTGTDVLGADTRD